MRIMILLFWIVALMSIVFCCVIACHAAFGDRRNRRYQITFASVDDRHDGVYLTRQGEAPSLVYRYPRGDEIEQEIGVRQAQAMRKLLEGER